VAAGVPHHVTQRGNRRQQTFFSDGDYAFYRALLAESCQKAGVEVWGYCLMPNHVHLILTPRDADGLRAALGETHRRYSRRINLREDWRGYLWQGRFASVPMDERHLMACARYVEMNPVRANLVTRPEDWPWSSAAAHITGLGDGLVKVAPLLDRAPDWRGVLDSALSQADYDAIRRGERTGRPLGGGAFVEGLEGTLGRTLKPQKRGPKFRASQPDADA
jgi:putative transposase